MGGRRRGERTARGGALPGSADGGFPDLVRGMRAGRTAGPRLAGLVQLLGRVGDDRAIDPLAAVLRDGPPEARAAAAQALGDLGLSQGIPALRAALADPAPEGRAASVRSVVRIAGVAARAVIEDYIARETDPRLQEAAPALLRH